MKIAYITTQSMKTDSGVTKKIFEQIKVWADLGVNVKLFAVVNPKDKQEIRDKTVNFIYTKSYLKRKFLNLNLINKVNKFKPDFVYFRQDLYSLNYEILSKKYKIIIELQTKDLNESRLLFIKQKKYGLLGFVAYLYFKITRSRYFKKATGLITVTNELIDYYSSFKKSSICIPNGIDIKKYSIVKKNANEKKIKFFFIGSNGMPWHGVDLIEKIAEKLPEYEFHIVGINKKSRLRNIKYYGFMKYENYIKILKNCHICIGTLALHRKNMKEASPLKVREYLAHGFPTIIGYEDTAFSKEKPNFILQLNLSKEQIDYTIINKIKNFVLKNKNKVVEHSEVENFIDVYILEQEKIEFLQNLLNNFTKIEKL
jgi:hypothetical protein